MEKFQKLREKYPEFVYKNYSVALAKDEVVFEYFYQLGEHEFRPKLHFSRKIISNSEVQAFLAAFSEENSLAKVRKSPNLNKKFVQVCDNLEFLAYQVGFFDLFSYYKLACSPKIVVECGFLSLAQQEFFKKNLYHGLGEFMYRNEIKILPTDFVDFEVKSEKWQNYTLKTDTEFVGNLITVGGGKDSIVSLELLKDYQAENRVFLLERNLYPRNEAGFASAKQAGYAGKDIVVFDLDFDQKLIELNKTGEFLNGHIPFSAGLAVIAEVAAYVSGRKNVVVSNEASANEGNITLEIPTKLDVSDKEESPEKNSAVNIQKIEVNHQYSKSYEFERDFRAYQEGFLTPEIEYFSLLRPWNEYQIVQEFLKHREYLPIFRSCNVGMKTNTWCGHCAKCLYVYIMLYPYLATDELMEIFGHDLLQDESMRSEFEGLSGITEVKPWECVGTIAEVNYALQEGRRRDEQAGIWLPKLIEEYVDSDLPEVNADLIVKYWNSEHFLPAEYEEILRKAMVK